MKDLVVFDLDGTLTESKSPLDEEMGVLLARLLGLVRTAVISGGAWAQCERQVIARLPVSADLENLSMLPTSGTAFYRYDRSWVKRYSEDFSEGEKAKINGALQSAVAASGFKAERPWGPMIEDRGSQITFSALGQKAPLDAKKTWDPDFSKRKQMLPVLEKMLPEFAVRLGGATSIDITKPGIDKAYGIRKLREILGVEIEDMLFVGDALFPGGNDYPARQAGVDSIEVRDPHETKRVIETIIACSGHRGAKCRPSS